jgi:hypothetical protein
VLAAPLFCCHQSKVNIRAGKFPPAEANGVLVCTENLNRVDAMMESPKLAE